MGSQIQEIILRSWLTYLSAKKKSHDTPFQAFINKDDIISGRSKMLSGEGGRVHNQQLTSEILFLKGCDEIPLRINDVGVS